MEIITSTSLSSFFSSQFFVAAIFTVFSVLLALLTFRSSKSRKSVGTGAAAPTSKCSCSCNGFVDGPSRTAGEAGGHLNSEEGKGKGKGKEMFRFERNAAMVTDRGTGASMMEQLVPEITTHALSYLDYPSLCRLSMTNSLMRKAANDDNAWKALYHKDFTFEQDNVTPVNGWKAYYAATRAIVNVNAQFFNIIRERSLPAMRRFWLNADYVKCVHATGERFSGYNSVIQSWEMAFNWEQGVDFQVQDVRARVSSDMAWVFMKAYVDVDTGAFNMSNFYEFKSGRWFLVHHHSSPLVNDGEVEQQVLLG